MKKKNLKEKSNIILIVLTIFMLLFMLVILTGCGDNSEEATGSNLNQDNSQSDEEVESKVGYYADVDGDGTVDGVIFADLLVGAQGDGQWENEDGNYDIPTISSDSVKEYYVSQEDYEGSFGTKDVLTPEGEGEDRFYVMALTDVTPDTGYCWYQSAYYIDGGMSDYETYTSTDFGKGKENTEKMIEKWDESGYGEQNHNRSYDDIWGAIKPEVEDGWFVPSRDEWSAFAEELGITKKNYDEFGLNRYYWSSSQKDEYTAWHAIFPNGYMLGDDVTWGRSVRLCTTF